MNNKIIVITGPTASGKTGLAVELAKIINGEIISADSMQIYKKMNIGTAKPTLIEMDGIPHHLIDFKEPYEEYTLNDYLQDVNKKVAEIKKRGKQVIMVGGTGLYITSFMDNIYLSEEKPDFQYRAFLKNLYYNEGGAALKQLLSGIDPETAERLHENDFRRITRALEIYKNTGIPQSVHISNSKKEAIYEFYAIGLNYKSREILYEKINKRVEQMIQKGLEEEARSLFNISSKTARQAIGYKQFIEYFEGKATLDETIEKIKKESRNYAKRQITWFKRDTRINWFYLDENTREEILKILKNTMEKFINV